MRLQVLKNKGIKNFNTIEVFNYDNITEEKFNWNPFKFRKNNYKNIEILFKQDTEIIKKVKLSSNLIFQYKINKSDIYIKLGLDEFYVENNENSKNFIQKIQQLKQIFIRYQKKTNKDLWYLIGLIILILFVFSSIKNLIQDNSYKKKTYESGMKYMTNEDYKTAKINFQKVLHYKNSKNKITNCNDKLDSINVNLFNFYYSQIDTLSYEDLQKAMGIKKNILARKISDDMNAKYDTFYFKYDELRQLRVAKDKKRQAKLKKEKEKQKRKLELAWRKNNKKAYKYYKFCERKGVTVSKYDCEKVAKNKIWIGMNIWLVIAKRGNPNDINSSNYGNGVRKQYCWYDWDPGYFYDNNSDGLIDSYN